MEASDRDAPCESSVTELRPDTGTSRRDLGDLESDSETGLERAVLASDVPEIPANVAE